MIRTALYRHFDGSDCLLYVGITRDPARRFAMHCATKGWVFDIATIRIEWLPTKEAALDAERRAIAIEGPRYNFQHISANRSRKAAPSSPVKHADLIAEIEAFCQEVGMAKTAFGDACMSDPSLVKNLRDGRELRGKTVRKLQQFIMASHVAPKKGVQQ